MIRIGDQEFEPAIETYEVLLGQEDDEELEGELVDEANGVAAELRHTLGRIMALAESDAPEFDAAALTELKAKRKVLRGRARTAARALFDVRLQSTARRLRPEPEVAFLKKHLTEQRLSEITEELNAVRPTESASGEDDETS